MIDRPVRRSACGGLAQTAILAESSAGGNRIPLLAAARATRRRARVGVLFLDLDRALDDFGTGYSSLTYLKRFPVDCIKIDQMFVAGVATDTYDAAIVQSVIDLARPAQDIDTLLTTVYPVDVGARTPVIDSTVPRHASIQRIG